MASSRFGRGGAMRVPVWWSSRRRTVAAAVLVAGVVLAAELAVTWPASAAATRYEAESATISQGLVATNHTGFSGTGFVDYTNGAGSHVEWAGSAADTGAAQLSVRHAHRATPHPP